MSKVTVIKCDLEERIKVQEYLFKKGYIWKYRDNYLREFKFCNVIYLFVDDNDFISWNDNGALNFYKNYGLKEG